MDGLETDSLFEVDDEAYRGQLPRTKASIINRERETNEESKKSPVAEIGIVASEFARPDDVDTESMPEIDTA